MKEEEKYQKKSEEKKRIKLWEELTMAECFIFQKLMLNEKICKKVLSEIRKIFLKCINGVFSEDAFSATIRTGYENIKLSREFRHSKRQKYGHRRGQKGIHIRTSS